MLLKKKILQVSDFRVFYLEGGEHFRKKGTRIFLHGWGLTVRAFEKTIAELSKHYHIIALDLPGFGRSDRVTHFLGYAAYAQFLSAFLKKVHIAEVHLIGQSMGGGICLAMGALFASQVKSIVLLNSAGIPMRKLPSIKMRAKEIAEQLHQSGYRSENWGIFNSLIYNSVRHLRFLVLSARLPIKHDLRPLLSRVKAPCLLAWGKKDDMLPVEAAYELQEHLEKTNLVLLPEYHHEWSVVYPEKLLALVKHFYTEHDI
jgi:pimeloyl-ACP methyl ester carboxylesterase